MIEIETVCTKCGDKFDSAIGVNARKPKPTSGDITMCATCGHVMEFGPDLKLRDLSEAQWKLIQNDPRIKIMREAIPLLNGSFH